MVSPVIDPESQSQLLEGVAPNDKSIVSVVFGLAFKVADDGGCDVDTSPSGAFRLSAEYVVAKARVPTKHTRPSILVRDIDLYAWRNFTDIVVRGRVQSASPVPRLEAKLELRGSKVNVDRTLVILGDRFVDRTDSGLVFTEPEPFMDMALTYENAYGGTDEAAEEKLMDRDLLDFFTKSFDKEENEELSLYSYPRNPAGKGYLVDEDGAVGTPLPNVEFADDRLRLSNLIRPLERWGEQPQVACMDWVHPAWFPRCAFLGDFPPTHDDRLPEAERALGLFEPNFEQKSVFDRPKHPFANGGPGFLSRYRLNGDETLSLGHATPKGEVSRVKLPALAPKVSLRVASEGRVKLPAALDRVEFDATERTLTLLWRATHFPTEQLPVDWAERSEYEISF
ncbi:MAG: DUF2169 domain-containing protein [Polyangiaceae bacterium]